MVTRSFRGPLTDKFGKIQRRSSRKEMAMSATMNDVRAGEAHEPIINMQGDRVALGPLHSGLLPLFARWDNDFWVIDRGGDEPGPRTSDTVREGWERLLKGEREDWLGFAIYALPELRPIGMVNIRDFQNRHGTAEFGITIIDAQDRGRGYGTEAVQL